MTRFFYRCLLRLHPRPFCQQFAEEMSWIFDQSDGKGRLMADAVWSLWRQWALRPQPEAAMKPVPMFYTGEDEIPRVDALIHGAILSLAAFSIVCFLISNAGSRQPRLVIGTHRQSPHLLGVKTAVPSAGLTTEVKLKALPEDPWREFAASYFKVILVLGALDTDHDFIISPDEIANAPAALRKLDRDGDGKLSPEECGQAWWGDVELPKSIRLGFMRLHPVLAVLDADHDGEISASEIQHAAAALRRLDTNHDGSLTGDEVAPDPVANRAVLKR